MPQWFFSTYPDDKELYSSTNAFSMSVFGFISSIVGGYLGDKYEKKGVYMTKAYVCIVCSLLGIPTIAACLLINNNFWISMSSLSLMFLLGEGWLGNALTMIVNTITPKNKPIHAPMRGSFLNKAKTLPRKRILRPE